MEEEHVVVPTVTSFSEPIPRKGTETTTAFCSFICFSRRCFSEPIHRKGTETTLLIRGQRRSGRPCFSEPIPRKGTETRDYGYTARSNTNQSFSEPIPRKGTETFLTDAEVAEEHPGMRVFQNLFPARGRKRFLSNSSISRTGNTQFFRTYSPQGDGNMSANCSK